MLNRQFVVDKLNNFSQAQFISYVILGFGTYGLAQNVFVILISRSSTKLFKQQTHR